MKKLFFIAVLLVFAASISFAQGQAQATATVYATVIGSLSITASNAAINFHEIPQNTSKTVSPINGGSDAAAFVVRGHPNHNITVSYDNSVSLTGPGNALTMNSSVSGNTANDQQNSTLLTSNPQTVQIGSDAKYYLWAGGTINVPSDQATGDYTGTFHITVAYP